MAVRNFAIIFFVIFLLYSVVAQVINVGISEMIKTDLVWLNYNKTLNNGLPLNISFEVYNSGSVGSNTRVRLDVLKENKTVFTGWSEEKPLQPGSRSYFEIYWYPFNMRGKFTIKLRNYIANEIKDLGSFQINVKDFTKAEKNIEILSPKIYKNEISLLLKSDENLENVLIIPTDYPTGWIIEQGKINKIRKNVIYDVEIKYDPSLWKKDSVTFIAVTEDGKYYGSKTFELKRACMLEEFVHNTIKFLEKVVSKIL